MQDPEKLPDPRNESESKAESPAAAQKSPQVPVPPIWKDGKPVPAEPSRGSSSSMTPCSMDSTPNGKLPLGSWCNCQITLHGTVPAISAALHGQTLALIHRGILEPIYN